jgi:hypothetical protein
LRYLCGIVLPRLPDVERKITHAQSFARSQRHRKPSVTIFVSVLNAQQKAAMHAWKIFTDAETGSWPLSDAASGMKVTGLWIGRKSAYTPSRLIGPVLGTARCSGRRLKRGMGSLTGQARKRAWAARVALRVKTRKSVAVGSWYN